MPKIKLPRIPRGNLGKIYVLSEPAANELFREFSDIVREHWPLPKEYVVPSVEGAKVILKSYPCLTLPYYINTVDEGSFRINVAYNQRNVGGGDMYTGCGEKILEFLCESNKGKDNSNMPSAAFPNRIIAPNTHILVYNLFRPEGISMPSDALKYGIIDHKIAEEIKNRTKPTFSDIADGVEDRLKKRGAILTRGWLSNQFVI